MAFRRNLAYRLFNISTKSTTTLLDCRISLASSVGRRSPAKVDPDPGDDGVLRRFLQWRPIYQSASAEARWTLSRGEKLLQKLRGMDISRDRIRLDGLIPPPVSPPEDKLTVLDARKLLRISQLEMVKSKLSQIKEDHISYADFVQICSEGCPNPAQGLEFAKILDESGTVIVLGDVVLLRPDQVVKAIQSVIPVPKARPEDPRWKELEEMEEQKAAIDGKAESLVRLELWGGLGYLVVQTAAFMRLTFWELSWDVMEPICFYVTSIYCMAGYAFFLRTSKEPSFEGFFQSRFNAKQTRLMKRQNFDVARYNELRRACYPPGQAASSSSTPTPPIVSNQ
ncbi:calcium uniporter protein 2, mitochondrial-like [Diospyros lotus]|uniref:calcium uniporter protein 2, mitochondrial-like n=1 Tax=Diospyros lotus TaxID=55363 RepID=UPI002250EE9A|nr:calcium uniporter protein 2, mitochondrial-like [Diospyros lotus]